jgi:predicted acyl esterase
MLPDGVDVAHVRKRLKLLRRPNVTITDPPTGVVFERDVEVPARDGTVLRVNVFRPDADGAYPVLLCAHPYGKNNLPKPKPKGAGYTTPFQLRMLPQSDPFSFSAWTSWESPDPAFWVPRGYVVVNCDLRGWGTSDGVGEILSEQEARDGHDLVEWAAAQPWSTGNVGMLGVSYLAISQWATASERPPHLAALAPWEGFTDGYRDFMRKGGVLERGFLHMWQFGLRQQKRSPVRVFKEAKKRPLFDEWWAARNRDIEAIDAPLLACASFSDHNLHSRGTFEGFRRSSSQQKWLYTHRGPKWSTFYASADARSAQTQFFDHFLKGLENGMATQPRVRVEVREDATTVSAVHHFDEWPPTGTRWEPLSLVAAGALVDTPPESERRVTFDLPRGRATFAYRFEHDTEIIGPMRVRLHLSLAGTKDMCVFAGIRKLRDDKIVGFEGSYGFDRALVTFGMAKASHRAVDPERSLPWLPFHPNTSAQPVRHGEIVALDIELPPAATLFRAGEMLRLDVQGRWFFPTNPIVGQMPARYERSRRGKCTLYCGGPYNAALLVPRVPTV